MSSTIIEFEELMKILNDSRSFIFFCVSSLFMFFISVIFISIFCAKKHHEFYHRCDYFFSVAKKRYRVLEDSSWWLIQTYFWPSAKIFETLGIDTVILLKTTRFLIAVSIGATCIVVVTVLPLHISKGTYNQSFIIRSSMQAMPEKSMLLSIHCVICYVITAYVCFLLYINWKDIIKYRQLWFIKDPFRISALLFSDLRQRYISDENWETNITNQIRRVIGESDVMFYVLRDVTMIKKSLKAHDRCIKKRCIDDKLESPDSTTGLTTGKGLMDPVTDTHHLSDDIDIANSYSLLKNQVTLAEETKLRAAILLLSNVGLSQTFRCTSMSIQEYTVKISLLPERTAIIWRNLALNPKIKTLSDRFILSLTILFILFSSIPFAATASFKDYILKKYSSYFLKNKSFYTTLLKFTIETLIPLVLIQTFLWFQHRIFKKLSTYENRVSFAQAEFSILKKMCIFNAINTFFIYTLSSSYITILAQLVYHPINVTEYLALVVPIQSNFYMVFLVFQTLIILPWILIKGDECFFHLFSKITAKIRKDKYNSTIFDSQHRPISSFYIYKFSYLLLAFGVGIVFIIISPMIFMVWIPYFLVAHAVFSYDEERNNLNIYLYDGEFWPIVSNVVIGYLIFMQLMMIGMLSLKNNYLLSICLIPNIIATAVFSVYLKNNFYKSFWYPTHDTMCKIKQFSQIEIVEKLKQYYVDSFVPKIDVTYADHLWTYVLERELYLRK